jgi:CTD nuclear envelope phosphatase 1
MTTAPIVRSLHRLDPTCRLTRPLTRRSRALVVLAFAFAMNSLSRFDAYVTAAFFGVRHPRRIPSSSSLSSSSSSPHGSPSKPALPQLHHSTPPPLSHPRLSNLPPTPRRKRSLRRRNPKPTTSFIKLPPPSTPIFLRIALALWSILLAIWRSLVGEIRAERTRRTRRRERASTAIRGLKMEVVSSDDGSASDGEGSPSEADGEGDGEGDGELGLEGVGPWIDPVTRATVEESAVDEPDDFEDPASTVPSRPDTFTFRLRSASKRDNVTLSGSYDPVPSPSTSQLEHKPFIRQPTPPGILSNPIPRPPSPPTTSSSRSHTPRLLPNPLSTSLLDPSVPAAPTLRSSFALHPTSFAKPHQTPFHLQKTLILDLDETLIHSTSRPLGYSASAGGGLLGLSLGGLLGGRKSRREGHTVEVVLNGRSTTYHVYKRPYVDHFLKKVSRARSIPALTPEIKRTLSILWVTRNASRR